jgi:hypothetical protein
MRAIRLILAALLSLTAVGCGDDDDAGVALNWLINRTGVGTVTCLDVSAASVEWTFSPTSGSDIVFTYDCVDTGQSEVVPTGDYQVGAKLRRGDSVVLAECDPCGGTACHISPAAPFNEQCVFDVL